MAPLANSLQPPSNPTNRQEAKNQHSPLSPPNSEQQTKFQANQDPHKQSCLQSKTQEAKKCYHIFSGGEPAASLSRTGHHPSEIKGFSKKENSEDGWTQEPNPGQAKDNLGEAASRVSEQQDRRSGASSLVSGDTQAVLLLAGAWRN